MNQTSPSTWSNQTRKNPENRMRLLYIITDHCWYSQTRHDMFNPWENMLTWSNCGRTETAKCIYEHGQTKEDGSPYTYHYSPGNDWPNQDKWNVATTESQTSPSDCHKECGTDMHPLSANFIYEYRHREFSNESATLIHRVRQLGQVVVLTHQVPLKYIKYCQHNNDRLAGASQPIIEMSIL